MIVLLSHCQVTAYNVYSSGSRVLSHSVRTSDGPPGRPEDVGVVAMAPDTAFVTWTEPKVVSVRGNKINN